MVERKRLSGWVLSSDFGIGPEDDPKAERQRRERVRRGREMLKGLRLDLQSRRANGESFDRAWGPTVNAATAGLAAHARAQWRAALAETADGWRRAYCGEADVAVARLAELEEVAA